MPAHAPVAVNSASAIRRKNPAPVSIAPAARTTTGFHYDFSGVRPHCAVADKSPDGGTPAVPATPPKATPPPPAPSPAPPSPAPKKAGVASFTTTWSKGPNADATNASLSLIFDATFKDDAAHDPALAEFRQTACHRFTIAEGPNKQSDSNCPLHDDNYSRADDPNHAKSDTAFVSNDNPGHFSMSADDVIDYSFTAEQTIIDTSQSGKVIAKTAAHTATIKGKHPRAWDGVPAVIRKTDVA